MEFFDSRMTDNLIKSTISSQINLELLPYQNSPELTQNGPEITHRAINIPSNDVLHIKQKLHHIPLIHHILLAFTAQPALVACFRQ